MSLSASDAADLVGMSKAGVIKAIRTGKISGVKDAQGVWRIEPVELLRVYPAVATKTPEHGQVNGYAPTVDARPHPVDAGPHSELTGLRAENAGLRDLVEQLKSERDDLRTRLDREGEERRKLTAALTDQRPPRSLWTKLTGG